MEIQFYPKSYGNIPPRDNNQYFRYNIMELEANELLRTIKKMDREDIIDWLIWNDPNGIYSDKDSIAEFGNTMGLKEGQGTMFRQVMAKRA